MKVIVHKIVLENFKGESHLEVLFGYLTYILGNNGLGKTRILDGIWWALFGKDSKGRKNFEFKSLDKDGNQIHGLLHSVRVTLIVDGEFIEFQRAVKEKWTKQKGMTDREFTGHTTTYSINDIPVSAINYTKKINEIVDEEIFKQITNVNYFTSLHWTVQRGVVSKLVGEISVADVIKGDSKLLVLREALSKMDISDYMKCLALDRKRWNSELILIPPRIDECNKQIKEHNYEQLLSDKGILKVNISWAREREKKKNIYLIKREEMRKILSKEGESAALGVENSPEGVLLKEGIIALEGINQNIRSCEMEIGYSEKKVIEIRGRMNYLGELLNEQNNRRDLLRESFNMEVGKKFVFNEEDGSCPTCLRAYDDETVTKLKVDGVRIFEEKKDKVLSGINIEGKRVLEVIKEVEGKFELESKELINEENRGCSLRDNLNNLFKERVLKEEEVKELQNKVSSLMEDNDVNLRIRQLELEMDKEFSDDLDYDCEELEVLENKLLVVNEGLNECKTNDELRARILELENRIKVISEEIAAIESTELLCEKFIRDRARIIERRFNGMFKGINFRLYKSQINGGLVECCEVTSEGVPFSNLNTGAQINCGLEIINVLSKHYNISAPVFIDNRESVNDIVDVDSQVINFMVTRDDSIVVKNYEDIKGAEGIEEVGKKRILEF